MFRFPRIWVSTKNICYKTQLLCHRYWLRRLSNQFSVGRRRNTEDSRLILYRLHLPKGSLRKQIATISRHKCFLLLCSLRVGKSRQFWLLQLKSWRLPKSWALDQQRSRCKQLALVNGVSTNFCVDSPRLCLLDQELIRTYNTYLFCLLSVLVLVGELFYSHINIRRL